MTGGTLDSSEDALSEEEDCGIYTFLGECSCDLENLATTDEAVGPQVDELVLKQRVMALSLMRKKKASQVCEWELGGNITHIHVHTQSSKISVELSLATSIFKKVVWAYFSS